MKTLRDGRVVFRTFSGRWFPAAMTAAIAALLAICGLQFTPSDDSVSRTLYCSAAAVVFFAGELRAARGGLFIEADQVVCRNFLRTRGIPIEAVKGVGISPEIAPFGYQYGLSSGYGLVVFGREFDLRVGAVFGRRAKVEQIASQVARVIRERRPPRKRGNYPL